MDKALAGNKIRELRTQLGMSQDDVAAKVGVTQGMIGHIERGERGASIEVWIAIANALDVDLTTLISADLTQDAEVMA